tara:strand:+ start:3412 stop:4383 length:972 start_codon:yes stop_codon:yes gene_type:complete
MISIIIPVLNEETRINACLNSIFLSTYKDFEVILVDDGSTDDTLGHANKYEVQIYRSNKEGPAYARNIGIKKARGDIFFFIDADVEIQPKNLQQIIDTFEQKKDISAIIGMRTKKSINKGITPNYWALWKYYMYKKTTGEYIDFFSTNRGAIKRSALEDVGGFDTIYKKADIEDYELGYRLREKGHMIYFNKDIEVSHHFPNLISSIKKTFRRNIYWTKIFIRRKKFDSVDITVDRGILAGVSFLILLLAIMGIFYNSLIYLDILLILSFLMLNGGLFAFILKEKGFKFFIYSIGINYIFSITLVLSAITSILGLVGLVIRKE